MWTINGSKYALSFGTTRLEIDASNGGRITALRVAGRDLLADSAATGQEDNWGSTFWPSPQAWPWPPTDPQSIAAINSDPYEVLSCDTSLTLRSALSAAPLTLIVTKKIWADLTKEAIVIEYTMHNGGALPLTVAPWEITRVPAGGITFYEPGSPPVSHGLPLMRTRELAGVTWYEHDPSDETLYKLFADGRGWIAQALGDLLLIKSFPDVSPEECADGEAEIEIYAAPNYVEVEQQGPVRTLAAGESVDWTVRWYARKLPLPVAVGNADLLSFVQNQIK